MAEVVAGLPVHSVQRVPEGVLVAVGSGRPRLFDAAVIATHPDQALLMLAEPTSAERMVLGAIPYTTNQAQLHTDESVLPRHHRARASWNYLMAPDCDDVLVTYDVTRLMRLAGPRRFMVTLGGRDRVDPTTVLAEMTYDHPLYTPESVAAQGRLPTIERRQDRLRGRLPRMGISRGRRGIWAAGGGAPRCDVAKWRSATGGCAVLTPALYRTRITHLRRAPVHHYFEHRSYSWYVDIDGLPELPRWLQPFARFEASDHFDGEPETHLRQRVDNFLADRGIDLRGGTITALLQARVLGYVFNPLSLYWCHDAEGVLRHVIAEVHNTYGGRHAYLLPPDAGQPAMVMKKLYVSPFNEVDGYYLVRAPRPDSELNVTISLHRENQPAFVATMRGARRPAGIRSDTSTAVDGAAGTADGFGGHPGPGHHTVVAPRSAGTAAGGRREGKGRAAVTVDIARLSPTPMCADRWPDVARVPSGPLSIVAAPIADRLFRNAAAQLPLRMVYPDGTVVGAADPTLPTMVIHRPDQLARRIGRYGLIGFGESYMAGEWSSDDLAGVLTEFAQLDW